MFVKRDIVKYFNEVYNSVNFHFVIIAMNIFLIDDDDDDLHGIEQH